MAINGNTLVRFYHRVRSIGFTDKMDSYENAGWVFSISSIVSVFTGIKRYPERPFGRAICPDHLGGGDCALFISGVVLVSNHYNVTGLPWSAVFHRLPVVTALLYAGNVDAGIELLFVLYVFSRFFLQEIHYVFLTLALRPVHLRLCIFTAATEFVLANQFPVLCHQPVVSLVAQSLSGSSDQSENTDYQKEMLYANWELKIPMKRLSQQLGTGPACRKLEEQTAQLGGTELGEEPPVLSGIARSRNADLRVAESFQRRCEQYFGERRHEDLCAGDT